MQNDHVLKKLNYDLLTHRVEVGSACKTICYHVAAFRDALTFDMQHGHVLKKLILTY